MKKYLTRFVFGAGIAATAATVGMLFGPKVGGILLAFPAILPASLTLIERKDGRHEAKVDATGALLGSVALIGFAVVAALALRRLNPAIALGLACATWAVIAAGLYVLMVRLPRRKRPLKIARPTST